MRAGTPMEILRSALAAAVILVGAHGTTLYAQAKPQQELPQLPPQTREEREQQRADTDNHPPHPLHEIDDAMLRLPLAAVLGAALALRPRRRGTPQRTPAVVETQIILAVVGAVIMLVIGASLARAFGIVGAANLIRYRSKIDDPKDAVVMLCALAVGLASGVGLYALAMFSTVFLVAALWVIESFEPKGVKAFDLKVKLGQDTDGSRPKIEEVLQRYRLKFELRTSSDEEVCYDVQVPLEIRTDRISNALLKLDPDGHASVDWSEKKKKAKAA
jgi:uncharacterized membrane protein YhiD involved in acid resistance